LTLVFLLTLLLALELRLALGWLTLLREVERTDPLLLLPPPPPGRVAAKDGAANRSPAAGRRIARR
jgi:hypothetical protein